MQRRTFHGILRAFTIGSLFMLSAVSCDLEPSKQTVVVEQSKPQDSSDKPSLPATRPRVGQPQPSAPPVHKRLLHYQTVGHSSTSSLGRVSANVCTPEEGWKPHIDKVLRPLVQRLGPGTFDWWGHNPGGIWQGTFIMVTKDAMSDMRFNQMDLARERFPKLADLSAVADFAHQNGIELYGYIGFPLCDKTDRFTFTPVPEQCDPDYFDLWYGEFVRCGFKGIGHDWSSALPAGSPALANNFPWLKSVGIEPFIEPVPSRANPHLLGLSVVAETWSWERAKTNPLRYSEEEVIEAGGRAIHLVLRPYRGAKVPDLTKWQFETSKRLLAEGHTVAVPLNQLMREGYPIEELVELAQTRPAKVR